MLASETVHAKHVIFKIRLTIALSYMCHSGKLYLLRLDILPRTSDQRFSIKMTHGLAAEAVNYYYYYGSCS